MDFRCDTVHPSSLGIMYQSGCSKDCCRQPHQQVSSVSLRIGDFGFAVSDFRVLSARCKFVARIPQDPIG